MQLLKMNNFNTLYWIFSFISALHLTDGDCELPESWRGTWFQTGLGQVAINQNSIHPKGYCVTHRDDYFLLNNREKNCYVCLLMIHRHHNLIQYKESFCIEEEDGDLNSVCSNIRIEMHLYTLIRESLSPIPCPFEGAYYFDYKDDMSSFCEADMSYAQPCAGGHKYMLNFTHCAPWTQFDSEEVELACIADWKDGSDMFMYGRLTAPTLLEDHTKYRCFKYKAYSSKVYVSMSADANCLGIRSPHDGHIVMDLSKDSKMWPDKQCSLPPWFDRAYFYRTVNGSHQLKLETDSRIEVSRLNDATGTFQTIHDVQCMQETLHNATGGLFTAEAFIMDKCHSVFGCLKIMKTNNDMFQVTFGGSTSNKDCGQFSMQDSPTVIKFLAMQDKTVSCPIQGVYESVIASNTVFCENCGTLFLEAGCNNSYSLNLHNSGFNKTYSMDLLCRSSWRERKSNIVVVQQRRTEDDLMGAVYCLNITEDKPGTMTIADSPSCFGPSAAPALLTKVASSKITFQRKRDTCKEKDVPPKVKQKKKDKKKKNISNNKRLSIEPDVEIILQDNSKNKTSDNKTETKRRKQLFTFSELARKQNQIFVVAEIICTAVFDIVYALVNR